MKLERIFHVSLSPARRGEVLSIAFAPQHVVAGGVGRHCWEVFEQRTSPCAGCPIGQRDASLDPSAFTTSEGGRYRIVSFEREPNDAALVSVVDLSDEVFHQVVALRVELASDRAGLSVQERAVLHGMVRGLQDKELAVELGIAPRTVKFHAANLLRKLGGGRRLDLFRLLLTVPLEGGDEPEASED